MPLGWGQESIQRLPWPCGSFGLLCPPVSPFLVPPLASALSSHPPQAEESLSLVSYLSLAPQWGFPFRSGLVLFGASRGLQHPAPTLLHVQPVPGLPGCLRPISYSLGGGGRSPVHPPNAPKCNFTGGLKGMRPENKSRRKRVQDGPVCAASWASCAFEGRDLGQDSPQKHQMRGARDES